MAELGFSWIDFGFSNLVRSMGEAYFVFVGNCERDGASNGNLNARIRFRLNNLRVAKPRQVYGELDSILGVGLE